MSLKKTDRLEANLYEITFDVDRAVFNAAIDKVYHKRAMSINVPGFRRGKAPRAIIEKMYGSGVFYEDALNEVIPDAFEAALKETELKPVNRPDFDVDTLDAESVILKAKFYVKPEVEVSDYFGIKAERVVAPVTDEDVDHEIGHVQERNSRTIEITDRTAELKDLVNIDYDGYVDGKAFDGGKAEGHEIVLGSGQFIPGFEDQIVGHNIGDEFDVNVEFPKDYHAEDLAGKPAVFKVKLNAIKLNELPALDDEFARDVSEFDTFSEYKADTRAKLEEKNAKNADAALDEKLIQTVVDSMKADIPECMFESETENFVRDYDTRLRMQGLDLQTYFKYTGLDLDALRKQMRPQAEAQVKMRLALEKIAEIEKIEVSDDELEAEYTRLAEAYQMDVEKVKEAISDPSDLKADLQTKKAVELIRTKAIITDVAPSDEKADEVAKKPDAIKTTAKIADTTDDSAKADENKPEAAKKPAVKKTTVKMSDDAEAAAEKAPAKKPVAKKPAAKKATAKTDTDAE